MFAVMPAHAQQTLNYKAVYHLGFINKVAGHGVITLAPDGDNTNVTFVGQSIPWGGRVYSVNDTLTVGPQQPLPNDNPTQQIIFRSGYYSKPLEAVLNGGSYNPQDPANYRTISGLGNLSASDDTMEAVAISTDMLGLIPLFQNSDFEKMQTGQQFDIPVTLPGDDVQHVYITYLGTDTYTTDWDTHSTYKVEFNYTYKGVKTDYPVTCQIDAQSRIPLLFSASIAIGKVELVYCK